ncbi:MAG: hypothetical protein Q8Q32_01880 [bacterium]|nr:hypothetical protein [bacterium]
MKKFLLFSTAIVSVWVVSASLVFAQTLAQSEDLQKAESELDASIAELSNEEKSELAKRVETFQKIVLFTRAEIKELSEKLEAVNIGFGDEFWDFYKALAKHLNIAEQTVNDFDLRLIEHDSRLEDIKALASEFKDWREGGYDLKNKALFDLILLDKSSSFIELAEERAGKIDKDLNKFKENFGELGSLQLRVLFARAQLEIGQAGNLHEEAQNLFEENYRELFFPGEQAESGESLNAEEGEGLESEEEDNGTSTPEEKLDDSEAINESEADGESSSNEEGEDLDAELDVSVQILGLVEQVRMRLASGYQFFIDMSELAKQLLSEE